MSRFIARLITNIPIPYILNCLLTYFKVGGEPKPRVSWTKEDGKVLTRTTSGGDKGDQLIIKRVQPDDEGQW